jgi:hypothetical protein
VAKVRHRRLDANPGLAGVGKDRQQGDGLGMQVDGLDPVSLQDHQEEGGEQRQQSGEDREEEERLRHRG